MSTCFSWEIFGGSKVQESGDKGLLCCWKVAEQVGCFAVGTVEKGNFIFFFSNLKDERDPFVQQMIGVQKFMRVYYYII